MAWGDPLTPELLVEASRLAGKLMGYSDDVEEKMNELCDDGVLTVEYSSAPKTFFEALDKKVWKCVECDIWHPPHELDEAELCIGCRPGEID